eukprot:122869_1
MYIINIIISSILKLKMVQSKHLYLQLMIYALLIFIWYRKYCNNSQLPIPLSDGTESLMNRINKNVITNYFNTDYINTYYTIIPTYNPTTSVPTILPTITITIIFVN